MARMTVTYFDIDDNEMRVSVNADDEACAIGVVLDHLGESIALASPFAVWREREPKRMGRKGTKAKMLGEPVPNVDDDETILAEELSDDDVVEPSPEVAALLEGVQSELGAEVETR